MSMAGIKLSSFFSPISFFPCQRKERTCVGYSTNFLRTLMIVLTLRVPYLNRDHINIGLYYTVYVPHIVILIVRWM